MAWNGFRFTLAFKDVKGGKRTVQKFLEEMKDLTDGYKRDHYDVEDNTKLHEDRIEFYVGIESRYFYQDATDLIQKLALQVSKGLSVRWDGDSDEGDSTTLHFGTPEGMVAAQKRDALAETLQILKTIGFEVDPDQFEQFLKTQETAKIA